MSGGGGIGGSGGDDPGWGKKRGRDDDPDNDPNKRRKTSDPPKPPRRPMARKEPRKGRPHMVVNTSVQEYDRVLFTPQLIETWLPSTWHIPKKGPSWVTVHWTGPGLNWKRCTRQG